jgi:hypothetical protein
VLYSVNNSPIASRIADEWILKSSSHHQIVEDRAMEYLMKKKKILTL